MHASLGSDHPFDFDPVHGVNDNKDWQSFFLAIAYPFTPTCLWQEIWFLNRRVVVLLRDSSDDSAVPFIAISAASKYGCTSFEGNPFRRPYLVASFVGAYGKCPHAVASFAQGNICENLVEFLEFISSCFILYNASVFMQATEVKVFVKALVDDERCSRACWR